MKITTYDDSDPGLTAMAAFLSREDVNIKKMFLSPQTDELHGIFYIFYEDAEDAGLQLGNEYGELKKLKAIAEMIRTDPVYAKLTNAKQRQLYLLDKHGLGKDTASTVIELIKVMEIQEEG